MFDVLVLWVGTAAPSSNTLREARRRIFGQQHLWGAMGIRRQEMRASGQAYPTASAPGRAPSWRRPTGPSTGAFPGRSSPPWPPGSLGICALLTVSDWSRRWPAGCPAGRTASGWWPPPRCSGIPRPPRRRRRPRPRPSPPVCGSPSEVGRQRPPRPRSPRAPPSPPSTEPCPSARACGSTTSTAATAATRPAWCTGPRSSGSPTSTCASARRSTGSTRRATSTGSCPRPTPPASACTAGTSRTSTTTRPTWPGPWPPSPTAPPTARSSTASPPTSRPAARASNINQADGPRRTARSCASVSATTTR